MTEQEVLRQRDWTKEELVAAGFRYYDGRKRVVLARELPECEAPLTVKTAGDTLVAEAGYMICFEAGEAVRKGLYDYAHWPVRRDHFSDLYKAWDEPGWKPTPAQLHLISLGCRPYYRSLGVWAKRVTQETLVQSIESPRPVVVPRGAWICIGAIGSAWGAPYSMDDESFRARYVL